MMNLSNIKKIILSLLFILTTCTSLYANPKLITYTDTTIVKNNTEIYKAFIDTDKIYVSIETSNPEIALSIIHRGVSIYYDVKGKKKRKVSITYPTGDKEISKPHLNSSNRRDPSSRSEEKPDPEFFSQLISHTLETNNSQEGVFKFYEEEYKFNILLNAQNITVEYNYNSETKIFTYLVSISKSHLSKDQIEDFSNLSIGVKTPARREQARLGNDNNNRGQGDARGQRGGRSGRDSGPPGGGSRGSGNGRPNQQQSEPTNEVKLSFWFKLNNE